MLLLLLLHVVPTVLYTARRAKDLAVSPIHDGVVGEELKLTDDDEEGIRNVATFC